MAKIKSKSLFLEDDLKNKNSKNDIRNNSAIMRDNTDDIIAKSSKKNGERCNSRKSKCDKNSTESMLNIAQALEKQMIKVDQIHAMSKLINEEIKKKKY